MENEWDLIHKIGKVDPHIAHGDDSSVSSVKNEDGFKVAVKEYNNPKFNWIRKEHQEAVLKEYYRDTDKAAEILKSNPNPLNQMIHVGEEEWPIEYKIVPQGAIMLEQSKNDLLYKDGAFRVEEKKSKALVGQEFIEGLHLRALKNKDHPSSWETSAALQRQEMLWGNSEQCLQIENRTLTLFSHLSKTLSSHFTYSPINIKPFVDNENKKIVLIITDLASNLRDYYEKTLRFKVLRKTA